MTTLPHSAPADGDRTFRLVLAFFVVIAAVLLGVVIVAVRNINGSERASDWVNHTHAVILEVDAALASVHVGDGALRTFAMTGDTHDQAAAREAFNDLNEHLAIAKALTRDEPAQREKIIQLEALATKRADLARAVFDTWPTDRAQAVRLLLGPDADFATMSEIRRVVDKLKAEQMALLAERDTAAFLQAQTTRWTVWSGVVLDSLLLAGVVWLIRNHLAARRRATEALEAANAQLEAKVQARTAELSASNQQLAAENLERRWAQQAAEHQLRYQLLIVNAINDPVFVITKALNISRVNPAVVHLTGAEPSALINQPLASIVRLAEDEVPDPLALALREGRDLRNQTATLLDHHGRQTWVRLTLFPVRDRDKVVGGVVVLTLIPSDRSSAL
jgi:PAS domain S-box-containing protein